MIRAHSLAAVEIILDGFHVETPETNAKLHAAGYTSISVHHPRFDVFEDPKKPDARPRRTIVVGVGRDGNIDPTAFDGTVVAGRFVECRKLQAFAVWAKTANELRELALALGVGNEHWRTYGAKPSHLPSLDAPGGVGRWFVCYASDDATLPEGIEFAQ